MRRILIISPHFPPVNAPDMQRVRLMLPHLPAFDWEPTVLAVAPAFVEGATVEPLLASTYPSDIRVVRVGGITSRWTRRFGFGSLWWRCGRAIKHAGESLLKEEKFDLVFFSTTQFDAFNLGPVWARKFGVPYVLDYQDPWVNDYYRRHGIRPPGGTLKFALSQWMANRNEPRAICHASGIVAVSHSYLSDLSRRYPHASSANWHQVVFGTSITDFQVAERHHPVSSIVNFDDGLTHFVYAGRCGPDMLIALTTLFRAFRLFLRSHPEDAKRMRFHFIGTDYAPPPRGKESVMPLVRELKLDEFVMEHCYRVPYFDALHYLQRAHAILVMGSNDATYSASKLYPYILARRPLITILHTKSPALTVAQKMGVQSTYQFTGTSDIDELAARIRTDWFESKEYTKVPDYKEENLAEILAPHLTQKLASVFEQACTTDND